MSSSKKNRLLALEQKQRSRKRKAGNRPRKLHKRPTAARHKRGGRVRAQALDQGEPIELTYNETTESYEAGEMSYEPADEGEAEAFETETFEEESEAVDWDEDEDGEPEAEALDWGEDDEAEAFEVEAFEENDEDLPEDLDSSIDAAQDYDQPSQAMSDSDFADDLQAIINGEKTYDRDRGGMVDTQGDDDGDELATAKSQTPVDETPPAPEAETNPHEVFSQMSQHMPHNRIGSSPQLAQAKSQATGEESEAEERPHDVFDRMGRNMSYANAFDLGSISMEQRFEELDEAIDKEEEKIQARAKAVQKKNAADDQETSAPLALDDAALVDDLDQMHQAMADEGGETDEGHNVDESDQAMQLAIDGVGYVTKTDKGGAYLHSIDTNEVGNITDVKSLKGRTRVPTGAQVLVDTGKTKDEYVWAHHNNKTGALRKSSIVMLETAAKPGTVVVSDVEVTDQGVQEKRAAPFYRINTPVTGGGPLTEFLKMEEQQTLPLGTKILVHPNVRSTDSDSIIWAMHVSGADTKVGAVDQGDVLIPSQAQYPRVTHPDDFKGLLQACWTTPWLKALYRGFLRTLYNAENLDFLSAVLQIKNEAQAKAVLAHFVSDGAAQRVNISGAVRPALVAAITNPPQNHADWRIPFGYDEQSGATFGEHIRGTNACSEIYTLLKKDFYSNKPKFGDQSARANYIAKLKE